MWGLGCLVWEAFNGALRTRGNLKDLENVSDSSAHCSKITITHHLFLDS